MSAFNYLFPQIWIAPMFLNFCYCEYLPTLNFSLIGFFFFFFRLHSKKCVYWVILYLYFLSSVNPPLYSPFFWSNTWSHYHFWPIWKKVKVHSMDYIVHGIFQASIELGSLSLFQGIFPTQGSNPGVPQCRQILYQLSHQGSLSLLQGILLT